VRVSSSRGNAGPAGNPVTFAAKRGPLRISVTESGTIKAQEQVILRCELEGRTSILSLVSEGTHVSKGDLLVELDASLLLDNKIDQEITVQNAEAAHISASENLAVVENQAQSDMDIAELTLEFANLDLKKYLEGEYPSLHREAETQIILAKEELSRAEEKLEWSEKLFKEKYISQTELMADQLAAKKAELELELTESNLGLLENFTYNRTVSQLVSDVNQADMALERTKRKARADIAQARADLMAKNSEYRRQKDKLAKTEQQIGKAKIYAPASGSVIHATSAKRRSHHSDTQPLDVGQEVKERQELIHLPTSLAVKAEVAIHESSLKKVRVGLPAVVTVDALPGKVFSARLAHIAPLPDARSMWANPDLKVYDADVYLDSNDSALRTGMSCKAQIIVKEYSDALYVPVQAVLRVGGEPTTYVFNGKDFEPRSVEIGLDNNRMVRIVSGLKEGEAVWLTPPLRSAAVELLVESVGTERVDYTDGTEATGGGGPAGDRPRREGGRRGSGRRHRTGMEFEKMSPEQMEKMRERFMNMSEEEREEMRRQWERGSE
jgi:HlyD family secretion protein